MKADLAAQRLSVTAAGFQIRRTNVPEADATGFIGQIGEAESRGVELEVIGRLATGLTARGGDAWTETEITHDTSGFTGRELPNAPRHAANFWLRYRFSPDTARGLMIAAGVVHVSDRFTGRDNAVVAPAYTRFDASASYELGHFTLGLVAQNLGNLHYVTSGAGQVFFAAPLRRIAAQLTTVF